MPSVHNDPVNKLASVFLCVCPVTDHELRRNIVKVALDSRGDRPTLEPRLVASLLRPHNHTISNKKTPLMQPPL